MLQLTKKVFLNKKTLVNRIPITNRAINDGTLELFYKLNKNLLEDSTYLQSSLNADLHEKGDFSIYLRNYHQKPY